MPQAHLFGLGLKIEKRESCTRLPVLHLVALELPCAIEQTVQKPHAEYGIYTHPQRSRAVSGWIYVSHVAIYNCLLLDCTKKFSRFQGIKKERLCKRLSYFESTTPVDSVCYPLLNDIAVEATLDAHPPYCGRRMPATGLLQGQ